MFVSFLWFRSRNLPSKQREDSLKEVTESLQKTNTALEEIHKEVRPLGYRGGERTAEKRVDPFFLNTFLNTFEAFVEG